MTPQFLKDVAGHKLTVLRDEGLYRHLRFSDGTSIMRFDLITWPGGLLYTGDMGTFVFQRLPDMLEFFRRREPRGLYECIDRRYWAEKLVATKTSGNGHREFSPQLFKDFVHGQRLHWVRFYRARMTREERRYLWDSMGELIERAEFHSSGHDCLQALHDWSWRNDSGRLRLNCHDANEWPDFDDYTHSFEWCCGALRFGIDLYDKHKEAAK